MKSMLLKSVVLLFTSMFVSAAADWPQWRGPSRDGHVQSRAWPELLDTNHLRQTWRVELGPSYSGPVVAGDRVFTTETKDKQSEIVTAFERASGRQLWQAKWDGALTVPFFAKANGDWIRATPACDGESLFVAGMRDVLVCLDAATGAERWRVDFVKQFDAPVPDFGFVCSPLVDGDAVYTQAGASVVKLNKRTGEVLWRALKDQGGMWGGAFSSPVIASPGGERQLIAQTREKIAGLALDTGKVLWLQPVEAFRGMNILTPVIEGDMLFTSTYGGKTIGFKLARTNGTYSIAQAWTHKSQGYMSTPVVVDGVAYEHLKSQRAMAIEVATGRELWTSDASFGKYWSLVANGERILALDERGTLLLFRASRKKFDLLDQRKIAKADTWAHLAVAGDDLFIRELNALAAYRWGGGASGTHRLLP